MSFTTYTTKAGERWDNVSYNAYGDPYQVGLIMEANPSVKITDVIPDGTVLLIPVIEQETLNSSLLPPWKQ